jgi:YfiH family protein
LGDHVGDDPAHVQQNRDRLCQQLAISPASVHWLNQVHGTDILEVSASTKSLLKPEYDGSVTKTAGQALVVMTADCLPLLLCDQTGTKVAAVHAGWRGLHAGIIEAAVRRFTDPSTLMVWMGPAISQAAFEVGQEVYDAFKAEDAANVACFDAVQGQSGKWMANLYGLARIRLMREGVNAIYGGEYCTYSDPNEFYSYRRDGQTGRMASLIWLTK